MTTRQATRRAPRGQAIVEMALGSLVFISVLAFGVYFAEVGFLSLKVQESAISALWDGTTGKMHTIPLSYDASGAMSSAAAKAQERYADFNGLSSEVHPSMQLLFTKGSDLSVQCTTGGAPDFEPLPIMFAYRSSGGTKCGSQALLSAVNFPRSFLDSGSGSLFQVKNMKDANTTLKVCGVGRPVGASCQGRYAMLIDDWGLSSTAETLPCLMIGGGLTSCPNLPLTAAVFSVYFPMSMTVIPHAAATMMAYGMVGFSPLPIGMASLGEPDEHMFFMSAANMETNFMQVPNLLPDDEQSNTLPWGTSPGAAVTLSALPYSASYFQRVANGSCFLGKKCQPY
jgi:hypothetical protein